MSVEAFHLANHTPVENDGLSAEAILVRNSLIANGLETPHRIAKMYVRTFPRLHSTGTAFEEMKRLSLIIEIGKN